MTIVHPGATVGLEVNPNLNPDTEHGLNRTVTQEVDPEALHILTGREAIREAEVEAGTAETGQEAGVVLTTVTKVVVEPIVEADPEVVLMVTTVDPVGHTPMIVTIAEVEVEGVTAIEDLEVTTEDPDLMALIAKAIAVTPTTEVPVRAADTAENASLAMETILNKFISVAFRKKNKNCSDDVTSEVGECFLSSLKLYHLAVNSLDCIHEERRTEAQLSCFMSNATFTKQKKV